MLLPSSSSLWEERTEFTLGSLSSDRTSLLPIFVLSALAAWCGSASPSTPRWVRLGGRLEPASFPWCKNLILGGPAEVEGRPRVGLS